MTWLYSIIGTPLGYILYFIYEFICSNVGVAIIIFTFIVKLVLLPIYIKQQKSTAKSSVFQPKVMEIQQKYRNNQQKQQEELMKLQQQGYKPYSGCLPMLLSFLILFGVIDVVYKPMTHIVHLNDEAIEGMVQTSYSVEIASFFTEQYNTNPDDIKKDADKEERELVLKDARRFVDYYNANCLKDGEAAYDMTVFETVSAQSVDIVETVVRKSIEQEYIDNPSDKKNNQKIISDTDIYKITDAEQAELDALTTDEEKSAYRAAHSFSKPMIEKLTTIQSYYGSYSCSSSVGGAQFTVTKSLQRELYSLERFGTVAANYGDDTSSKIYSSVSSATKAELMELYDNLNFLGIPLGQVPKDHMGFPMILVPIVSFLLSMLQTFISNRNMRKQNPDTAKSMGGMNIMLWIMPFMSLWIAFTVPAGAGFYWAISYAFGIGQTFLLNKLYDPVKLRQEAEAEIKALEKASKKKSKPTQETVTIVNEDGSKEVLSQKELNRRKLAEARRADAEKYGEEYHEDSGDNDDVNDDIGDSDNADENDD